MLKANYKKILISLKQISCIYLFLNIVKFFVISICYNSLTFLLKLIKIIHNSRAKESCSIFKRWLVDYDSCSLCLNSLHYALNGALTEVIRITLHCKSIYTYNSFVVFSLLCRIIISTSNISICYFKHSICYKIFSCSVTFHNSLYKVLWNILIVC